MLSRLRKVWPIAILIATAACIPPEEDPTVVRPFEEDTIMGELQARGDIVIGIEPDFAPFSAMPETGPPEGFLVGIGEIVADELGVEAQFVPIAGDEMLAAVEGGRADLVFPPVPITESLARNHTLADPYYVAHQRFLGRKDDPLDDPEVGTRVCWFTFPETGVPLASLNAELDVIEVVDPFDCIRPFVLGRVEAITAPDNFLIATLARLDCPGEPCAQMFRIQGDDLTTEGFGPAVELGANGFADFVNTAMEEAKNDGRFMDIYNRWIAPYLQDPPTEPPRMTIEEAAALYPSGR